MTVRQRPIADYFSSTPSKGRLVQGGVSELTLCKKCNNDTGAWYGDEYVRWAKEADAVLTTLSATQIDAQRSLTLRLRDVKPANFLKQVVTCFFSVIPTPGDEFARANPLLKDFVLNPAQKALPDNFRFYLCLYSGGTRSPYLRRSPLAARLRGAYPKPGRSGSLRVIEMATLHEYAHPPFMLVMTDTLESTFSEGRDITMFSQFDYDEVIQSLPLELRVAHGRTPWGGSMD
jgi:hypothetical protein